MEKRLTKEEFLKDLWHPADEEPKKNRLVLTDTRSIMDKDYICWTTVKLTENGFIRLVLTRKEYSIIMGIIYSRKKECSQRIYLQ